MAPSSSADGDVMRGLEPGKVSGGKPLQRILPYSVTLENALSDGTRAQGWHCDTGECPLVMA